MVTSTKAVIKLLEQEFKKNGYKLTERDDETIIQTQSAVVIYITDKIPREILGVIAKHSGMIPNSMSYTCSKRGGVQMLLDDSNEPQFLSVPITGNATELHPTPLTYLNTVLYQDEDNKIFGLLAEHTDLVGNPTVKPIRRGETSVIAWYGESDQLYMVAKTSSDNAMLADLEYKRWELL